MEGLVQRPKEPADFCDGIVHRSLTRRYAPDRKLPVVANDQLDELADCEIVNSGCVGYASYFKYDLPRVFLFC